MPSTARRFLASVTAWAVGAGVAVAVGVLALSLINSGFAAGGVQPVPMDGPVLPPSPSPVVAPSLAAPVMSPAAPSESAGPPRQLASTGGTVVARCTGDGAYLVSWSPAQGYDVEAVHRGPGRVASVLFQASDQHVWLGVHCVSGVPALLPVRHDE